MIRPLFSKHQKELVAFANTNYGRDFVSQFGGKELKENYPIIKVAPDGIHQHLEGNTFRAIFYPRSPYVKHFAEVLTQVDIAKDNGYDSKRKELVIPHYLGETRLLDNELPTIYLNSATFNPNANPESTSVDGRADRIVITPFESWATIVAGAGVNALDTGATIDLYTRSEASPNWQTLIRSYSLFDTSSLSAGAIISSAIYSIYCTAKVDDINTGVMALSLITTTPASNTAIVAADYTQTGTTKQATDILVGSFTTSAYNNYTLNATGLTNVSKTSITKFGHRLSLDISGTPTHPAAPGVRSEVDYYSADNATNKPKLVVTYTVPGFLLFM